MCEMCEMCEMCRDVCCVPCVIISWMQMESEEKTNLDHLSHVLFGCENQFKVNYPSRRTIQQ
jgi:hypothetical protein